MVSERCVTRRGISDRRHWDGVGGLGGECGKEVLDLTRAVAIAGCKEQERGLSRVLLHGCGSSSCHG